MATYEQTIKALRAADQAGNTEDAKRLAQIARRLKPAKKSLGSMPFVNREIAEGVGYLPDKLLQATAPGRRAVSDAARKLPESVQRGLGFADKAGSMLPGALSWGPNPAATMTQVLKGFSSENLKRTMEDYGIRLAEEDRAPKAASEHIGRAVGEASNYLLPFGYGTKHLKGLETASGARGLIGRIASDAWKGIVKHPWMSMLTELTAATGAGGGRHTAEEFSNNEGVRFAGEMVGGVAGGVAPSVAARMLPARWLLQKGERLVRKLALPFTEAGGKYRAGQIVKSLTPDTNQTIQALDDKTFQDLPP